LADLDVLSLPVSLTELLRDVEGKQLQARIADADRRITARTRADEACARLRAIIGVGPITADAVVATIGSAQDFKNGRQLAAWLGLVPTQHSSCGRSRLGRISCSDDGYLRTLLIQGARRSLQRAKATAWGEATPEQRWIQDLERQLPFGKLVVAIANKRACQLWAMLARIEHYDADPGPRIRQQDRLRICSLAAVEPAQADTQHATQPTRSSCRQRAKGKSAPCVELTGVSLRNS
jgi:hypothetical protein